MRATAAEERKKRKESHGGGRTAVSSLPPSRRRRRRRGTATRPRRRRRGTSAGKGEGNSDAYHRGWEAVEHRPKAGRMRHVTMPDGVGHPTNVKLVGTPKVSRDLSLSVKEGPGWGERAACFYPPPLSPSPPLFPPLRRRCLSPFGGVQSSRASRATRTLSPL